MQAFKWELPMVKEPRAAGVAGRAVLQLDREHAYVRARDAQRKHGFDA